VAGEQRLNTTNMTTRQRMASLLEGNLLDDAVVAPMAESDYACYIKGSQWPTDVDSLDDYIRAADRCGYDPIFFVPLDFGKFDPQLAMQTEELSRSDSVIVRRHRLNTPKGDLVMITEEKVGLIPYMTDGSITTTAQYPILEWYFDRIKGCGDAIRAEVEAAVEKVGSRGLVCEGAGNTFELYFAKYPDLLYLYMDDPSAHLQLMERFFEAQQVIMASTLAGGADIIYASGVAAEMMSPQMFEQTFLPYLKRQREFVNSHGGWFYYHSCGYTKKFIEAGFYNEILPDLFETLSPPPYGVISDLRAAREMLDPRICTKGNFDTELLRRGPTEAIARAAREIVEATWPYRHMVALADSILYGTPPEHVRCLVDTAKAHHRQQLS